MGFSLREHYLGYLDALNRQQFDELPSFVGESLTYNGMSLTGLEYRLARENDFRTIPDLSFTVDRLVVGDDQVACRIWFDCTPVQTFHGLQPTGHRISFAEHVFYRFRGPHIVEVWSLLDTDALRRQMSGPSR